MVRNICDEYLLGKFVLVAPVTAPGKFAREVYLPEGEWYDYETNEKYTGGKYILADAPLDKVPVFIRAGAILPVAEGNIQSTEDITSENTRILTYLTTMRTTMKHSPTARAHTMPWNTH